MILREVSRRQKDSMKATRAISLSEKSYITIINCQNFMFNSVLALRANELNVLDSKLCPRYSQVLELGYWAAWVEAFRSK